LSGSRAFRIKNSGGQQAVVGRTISHYQVLGKLGEGGMGVVWEARDSRLKRTVVLKFVKHQFTERFEREARAIAALNHPHICTLYDVGQHEGEPYLVMERVEGKPLKGPLPLHDTLKIAIQVADALASAHAKGIVHRDLKPSNVLVDAKGNVKVLDFGLAKLVQQAPPEGEETRTLQGATEEGRIVGTTAYMSPEQAEGKPVDARSDIFSFGSVLYEMVTGRQAFKSDSKISTLAAVLTREPEPIPPVFPVELGRIVAKCLRKDPERRFQHIDDVKGALEDLWEEVQAAKSTAAPVTTGAARPEDKPPIRRHVLLAAGVAVSIALLAGAAGWFTSRLLAPPPGPLQFVVLPPGGDRLASDYQSIAASPDGSSLVYAAIRAGKTALRWRRLDSVTDREIAGTAGASQPFFSPDGAWLGFVRGSALLKVPVAGGPPTTVVKIQETFLAPAWSEDGFIYFGRTPRPCILRVSENGGLQQEVTKWGGVKVKRRNIIRQRPNRSREAAG
jgi:serine/threonine-protein kinase